MIVGILSDTHDRLPATRAAVELLRTRGAEFLIHCGDVGGEQIIDQLAGDVPSAFVFGNNDWDTRGLQRYAAELGIQCLGAADELELGGKTFYVTHGDDFRALRTAIESQRYDYVLHGHTHVRRDDRVGRTRIINPGAMHRAKEKTVALLNTDSDDLTFFPI
jgi:putative phosphoesterase